MNESTGNNEDHDSTENEKPSESPPAVPPMVDDEEPPQVESDAPAVPPMIGEEDNEKEDDDIDSILPPIEPDILDPETEEYVSSPLENDPAEFIETTDAPTGGLATEEKQTIPAPKGIDFPTPPETTNDVTEETHDISAPEVGKTPEEEQLPATIDASEVDVSEEEEEDTIGAAEMGPNQMDGEAEEISDEEFSEAAGGTTEEEGDDEGNSHGDDDEPSVEEVSSTDVVEATGTRLASSQKIGDKLVSEGVISQDQLDVAVKMQNDTKNAGKNMLGHILVELGFITESALGEVLAESTGVEQFDPKKTVLDPNLIKQVPKNICTRHKVLPVVMEDNNIYLAMADIYNVLAIDQVQRHFPKNYKIVPLYCPEAEILEMIDNYYDYELSVDGILKEIETGVEDKAKLTGEEEGYTNPTVRLVDALLIDAIKRGASDIHFEPEGSFLRLRYRVDGKLLQIRTFHKDYWSAIVVRLKIISGMNIAENRKPQDGRITYTVLGREVDFRVSAQPTIHGENVVLRILDKKKALLPMEQLGMNEHNVKILQKMIKRPEGIIIVTGPTGSGKTTTLYSVLNYINSVDVNIMTLEDPVEYQLSMIRQSHIRKGGMTFADGIKSLLRQDPDIIFVGEIRDGETAEMALRAAMTGHQVYSTLHTNDALGAIPRLVDIGIKPQLLSGAVIGVVAQRLARKLCTECKQARPATEEECKVFKVPSDDPPSIYVHNGCETCNNTGYKGRISITEIIHVDKAMDELLATDATREQMRIHLVEHGFKSMQDDGVDKILQGVTDLDELIRTIDMTDRF